MFIRRSNGLSLLLLIIVKYIKIDEGLLNEKSQGCENGAFCSVLFRSIFTFFILNTNRNGVRFSLVFLYLLVNFSLSLFFSLLFLHFRFLIFRISLSGISANKNAMMFRSSAIIIIFLHCISPFVFLFVLIKHFLGMPLTGVFVLFVVGGYFSFFSLSVYSSSFSSSGMTVLLFYVEKLFLCYIFWFIFMFVHKICLYCIEFLFFRM